MTEDLHTLTGAYAVDALPDDERLAFEQHLAVCAACADEVRGLQATGARLGEAAATTVPPSLRDAVMAQVRVTRQVPPLVTPDQLATRRRRRLLRRDGRTPLSLMAVAAALAILAAGLGVVGIQQHRAADRSQALASTISAVIAAPDARLVDDSGARVIVSRAQGRAIFVDQGLPAATADHVLQLWVIDGGIRSAGILHGATPLVATGIRSGTKLAITVEPAGGSPQPTTDPIWSVDV